MNGPFQRREAPRVSTPSSAPKVSFHDPSLRGAERRATIARMIDIDQLRAWEGRSEHHDDLITAAPLRALAAMLDRDAPAPDAPVPPLAHWLYFLPTPAQREIGPDGHPKRGGFLPPVTLPRRMWAAGRLRWHAPLQVGLPAQRVSHIESVKHKSGRSGELVFVTVRHEVSQCGAPCLTEHQDIVYRAAPQPGDPVPELVRSAHEPAWSREVEPDEVLLFRFSALTFNGHRIHYDRDYATQAEGYPGLVVHGPLIATLLADLARRERPGATLARFEFKAVRPTFDVAPFRVSGRMAADGTTLDLWATDREGWLTMQATATLA